MESQDPQQRIAELEKELAESRRIAELDSELATPKGGEQAAQSGSNMSVAPAALTLQPGFRVQTRRPLRRSPNANDVAAAPVDTRLADAPRRTPASSAGKRQRRKDGEIPWPRFTWRGCLRPQPVHPESRRLYVTVTECLRRRAFPYIGSRASVQPSEVTEWYVDELSRCRIARGGVGADASRH
jgi:hypothetical protein